jgi:ApaG protein
MYTAVTSGIHVHVTARYEPAYSQPEASRHFFSYYIRIENRSDSAVKLLRRRWHIFDSEGVVREVEGPGVVGMTPVIEPAAAYTYNSACDLNSPFGAMHGTYTMIIMENGKHVEVEIPRFRLEVPWMLN